MWRRVYSISEEILSKEISTKITNDQILTEDAKKSQEKII